MKKQYVYRPNVSNNYLEVFKNSNVFRNEIKSINKRLIPSGFRLRLRGRGPCSVRTNKYEEVHMESAPVVVVYAQLYNKNWNQWHTINRAHKQFALIQNTFNLYTENR